MSSRETNNGVGEYMDEFSVESILAEYKSLIDADEEKARYDDYSEGSKDISPQYLEDGTTQFNLSSEDSFPPDKQKKSAERKPKTHKASSGLRNQAAGQSVREDVTAPTRRIDPGEIIESSYDDSKAKEYASVKEETPKRKEPVIRPAVSYVPVDDYPDEEEKQSGLSRFKKSAGGIKERFLSFKATQEDDEEEDEYYEDEALDDEKASEEEQSHLSYTSAEEFLGTAAQEAEPEPEHDDYQPEIQEEELTYDEDEEYASDDYPEDYEDEDRYQEEPQKAKPDFRKFVVGVFASLSFMLQERKKAAEEAEKAAETEDIPEVHPVQASKHYGAQLHPLRMRTVTSTFLCIIITYISIAVDKGWILPKAIAQSNKAAIVICLLIELSVMIIGLDLFTNGLLSIARRRIGGEAMVSISCLVSVADALIIIITGDKGLGLPFCAISSLSVCFGLWGQRFTCTGYKHCFRTASFSASPFSVAAQGEVLEEGDVLLKSQGRIEGFVRKAEEADFGENIHELVTPFLLVLSAVISLMLAIKQKSVGSFFHILSLTTAVSASFSTLTVFPLYFSIVSRRLLQSGAAIAGYAGARDIGKSKNLVIKDDDVFPQGTMGIDSIHIPDGISSDKVLSYTGSVIVASGSGLCPLFRELLARNNCSMKTVDNYSPHEAGGLMAVVAGEQVYVGSTGFMSLMGIKIPGRLKSKNAVYVSISGVLCGIFNIDYRATASVQASLFSMLHSRVKPYFAIRDFNITPLLIEQKFGTPGGAFDFPPYQERYDVSMAQSDPGARPAAVFIRDSLSYLSTTAIVGRRLYAYTRLGVILSVIFTFIGVGLMAFLCAAGAFTSASASNILLYMLISQVPILVIAFGLRR